MGVKDNVERAAFSAAIDEVLKNVKKNPQKSLLKIVIIILFRFMNYLKVKERIIWILWKRKLKIIKKIKKKLRIIKKLLKMNNYIYLVYWVLV